MYINIPRVKYFIDLTSLVQLAWHTMLIISLINPLKFEITGRSK